MSDHSEPSPEEVASLMHSVDAILKKHTGHDTRDVVLRPAGSGNILFAAWCTNCSEFISAVPISQKVYETLVKGGIVPPVGKFYPD